MEAEKKICLVLVLVVTVQRHCQKAALLDEQIAKCKDPRATKLKEWQGGWEASAHILQEQTCWDTARTYVPNWVQERNLASLEDYEEAVQP